MRFRLLALLAFASVLASACSTPLSLRGARVMEPGEVEIIGSGQLQAVSGFGINGAQSAATAPLFLPWVEASVRFGLFDRADLQLRFDPSILPEIDFGYQLVGNPAKDDELAVTVTGGIKGTLVGAGNAGLIYLNTPLQLLVDVPLGEMFGLMGGLRVIPNALIAFGGASGAGSVGAAPGAVVGLRIKVGGFVLSPEFAFSANFPVLGAAATVPGASTGALGVGAVSGTFGFNIGGQFGGPDKTKPQPAAAPAPASAMTEAPADPASTTPAPF